VKAAGKCLVNSNGSDEVASVVAERRWDFL